MAAVRKVTIPKRTPTLAVIMHVSRRTLPKNSAPALQLDGIRTRARALGFALDEFDLIESPLPPRRLESILKARGIQGIVFLASIAPPLPLEVLKVGVGFTCAVSGVRYPSLPFHVTIPDFLAAGRTSILEILNMGYRRPGVIISRLVDEPLNWGFSGGAFTGLLSVEPENRLPLFFIDPAESCERTVAWVREHRPDAILSLDVRHTVESLKQLPADGPAIPCYSLDWYPPQEVMGGIDLMQRDVGAAAVDLVVDQLSRGEVGIPTNQHCLNIEGIWATKQQYYESHFVDEK
jgi:hypothetical protein